MKIPTFLLALWLFSTAAYSQSILHVLPSAIGANNGTSWSDAFTDLQPALAAAQPGDEVWVAEGTYYPTVDGNRLVSFEPPSGIRLLGGFEGTEAVAGQRNWTDQVTELSGDIGVPNDSTDNSYCVLYLAFSDSSTVIDGFLIRHGQADNPDFNLSGRARGRAGAGLYIMGNDAFAYPDLINCRIENNYAEAYGAGAFVSGEGFASVAPRFINCTFRYNTARLDGGALYKFCGSYVERAPDFGGCTFEYNTGQRNAGVIYIYEKEGNDRMEFDSCLFQYNSSPKTTAVYVYISREYGTSVDVINSVFRGNGDSLSTNLIGLFNPNYYFYDSVKFRNDTFEENYLYYSLLFVDATNIDNHSRKVKLDSCIFKGNKTVGITQNIRVLQISECDYVALTNSKFTENSILRLSMSSFDTSILTNNVFLGSSDFLNFTNFSCSSKEIFYTNNIFNFKNKPPVVFDFPSFENHVNFISNIWYNSISNNVNGLYKCTSANIFNNIFIKTPSPVNLIPSESIDYRNNYFDSLDIGALPAYVTWGTGNVVGGDPLLVDTALGDFHLLPCSPLRNAGTNFGAINIPFDLEGYPRIQGGTVDIGPYETPAPNLASPPVVQSACAATANGSVGLLAENGCAPYAFQWQSGAAMGSDTTGLLPGDYVFTITDAQGSSFTAAVFIPTALGPEASASAVPVVCGDTLGGSALAQATSGTPPYTWHWQGGFADSLLAPLAPGTYACTVSDAHGCTAIAVAEVETTGNLSIGVEVSDISCHGAADGAFEVQPVNGLAPYQWLWSDGQTTPDITGLAPGIYTGSLTDSFGCAVQWVLPLEEPQPLAAQADIAFTTDSLAANGSILLTSITGGTEPYQVVWSNGAVGLLNGNLAYGDYTAVITDAHGCVLEQVYSVGVTSGVGNVGHFYRWRVFPNPVRDVLSITPVDVPGFFRLYDARGGLVLEQPASGQVPMGHLASGVYVLRFYGDGAERSWRVVKE